MADDAKMNQELPKLRAALTRARKSKNPDRIIETVRLAKQRFDEIGYPDQWSNWERAESDALMSRQYGTPMQ